MKKQSKGKPRGPRRWSLLSPRQQYRLRHRRAKWLAETEKSYVNYARGIREVRKAKGMSQREMSAIMKVSLRQYKRWEAGQSMPMEARKVGST